MTRRTRYALIGLSVIAAVAVAAVPLRPRPTRLAVTARAGDDTVVINQVHPTRLAAFVTDQYGRKLSSTAAVQYERVAGDSMRLSSSGEVHCADRRDAVVRATFRHLSRQFVLRCRPVTSIEAPTWLDLVIGDSTRDLSFVAHGPDGSAVTELRGAVTIENGSIVAARGTTIRPQGPGQTFAIIDVGDAKAEIPIVVYQLVTTFVETPQRTPLMAMRVTLARGDTIEVPVPKSAFWVTYFSKDPTAAPPTIELRGEGACTTGDGMRARRIEEGEYAKYCHAGTGTRMRIAHGEIGASVVRGVVAIRLMW